MRQELDRKSEDKMCFLTKIGMTDQYLFSNASCYRPVYKYYRWAVMNLYGWYSSVLLSVLHLLEFQIYLFLLHTYIIFGDYSTLVRESQ